MDILSPISTNLPLPIPSLPVDLPVDLPVTSPVNLPVNLPVDIPVNVPSLPVDLPVDLPVTSPVTLPVPIDLSNCTITEPCVREIFQEIVITTIENPMVQQIKFYADQIKCEDFKGKGTIDDYTNLFEAASKIANETKHVQLDIDIEGFNQFGHAADELTRLFTSFTKKIQSINIIDDTLFLSAVLSALQKVVALSKAFGAFQECILVKNTIELSSSIGETKRILENVSEEVNCAMDYISHFSSPTNLEGANLNHVNRNAITRACTTIDAWNTIYKNGASMAMNDNADIQYIKRTNQTFIRQSAQLRTSTNIIRSRYSYYF